MRKNKAAMVSGVVAHSRFPYPAVLSAMVDLL
jgi:hypothetical protein